MLGILVFARMDSSRLPGKAMADLGGRPMLARVLDRVRRSKRCKNVLLATTDRAIDDVLVDLAAREGVPVFRGDCLDVAGRAVAGCELNALTSFVRVSGDSPFMPAELIDRAIDTADERDADVVTNVFRRTFPPGASVEVVRVPALRAAAPDMTDNDRENVTSIFYRLPDAWRIVNFEAPDARYGGIRLTVDTAEELARARALALRLGPRFDTATLDEVADEWRMVGQGAG